MTMEIIYEIFVIRMLLVSSPPLQEVGDEVGLMSVGIRSIGMMRFVTFLAMLKILANVEIYVTSKRQKYSFCTFAVEIRDSCSKYENRNLVEYCIYVFF